jgi:hypothetical protein
VTHIFDTGNEQPQRTIVQTAAVALLGALKRSNGGYLQDVIPWGGIVRSYTDEVDIQLLIKQCGRTPSIAVALATRSFETINVQRSAFKSDLQLLLYFATQHSRDMQKGRHEADIAALANDQADPGLHIMMAHALELMVGVFPTTLTSTIKQIIPEREEEVATLPEITIWMQTYRVMMTTLTPRGGGGTEWRTPGQLLESIGWRTTTKPTETNRPTAPTDSTTLDSDTDLT